jgi:hypothetical protein
MTGGTVSYFATADVLALIFDNTGDSLNGLQPSPMKGKSSARPSGTLRVQRISASSKDHIRQIPEDETTASKRSPSATEGAALQSP